MKSFDPAKAVREAARLPWYNFLLPRPFPPFREATSLEDANFFARAYHSEVHNLQIGRAIWAWSSITFAIVAAIGWLA